MKPPLHTLDAYPGDPAAASRASTLTVMFLLAGLHGAAIAALPELVKPREPFDIFRAKTIKKLHERNPTMEYAFLKETAEQMWEVLRSSGA